MTAVIGDGSICNMHTVHEYI